MVEAKYFVSL